MLGMARTWALELAGDGITVNVVAPGPIRTDMFHEVVPAGSDKERSLAASVPVRRLGEPADVARAVRFLHRARMPALSPGRSSTSAAAPASAASFSSDVLRERGVTPTARDREAETALARRAAFD